MYQRFFGMERKPFGVSPRLSSYCPVPEHEEAIAALRYVVLQGAGIGLVLGDSGMGKTTVCLRLSQLLDPTYAIAFVTQTNFATVKAFYQAIHYDLGLPYYGMDEQELRLSFSDFALARLAAGGKTVLIVDEGQNLTDRILEEIRLLADVDAQDKGMVQVILAARPELKERLADPFFGSLRQRIAITVQLQPLSLLDTIGYVRSQIRAAGAEPERLISEDAIERVHELSGGVPRVINRLCDHAFLIAFAAEKPMVDRDTIDAAWVELQEVELANQQIQAPDVAEATPSLKTQQEVPPSRLRQRREPAPANLPAGDLGGVKEGEAAGLPFADSALVYVEADGIGTTAAAESTMLMPPESAEGAEVFVTASTGEASAVPADPVPVDDPYRLMDARLQGQQLPAAPGAAEPGGGAAEAAADEPQAAHVAEEWDAVEIGPEDGADISHGLGMVSGLQQVLPEKDITTHPPHGDEKRKPHDVRQTAKRIFSRLQQRYD